MENMLGGRYYVKCHCGDIGMNYIKSTNIVVNTVYVLTSPNYVQNLYYLNILSNG